MDGSASPGAPEAPTTGRLVDFPKPPPQPEGRGRWRLWRIGIVVGVVAAVIVGGWWLLPSDATVRYTTAEISRGDVARTVTATGTVNPELTIIVGTYVSGVIKELFCDYNTRVRKGQVCAKIDPRPYQSVVDQARANLEIARAQLEKDKASLAYAKAAYERHDQLVASGSTSRDVYENAKSAYAQAQAQVVFAEATIQLRQASLDAAQVNLDYTDIVSPVDGTVVSRNVTMGQTVAASFQTPTLFLIATDLTRMQVDTNVSESDIGGLAAGNEATFTVDAFPRRTFRGKLAQVRQSPQTVQNVVTYDAVIAVDNSDLALKPGMTASARIVIERRTNVIRVPSRALRYTPSTKTGATSRDDVGSASRDHGEARIWILRDGRPVPVAVEAGIDDDSFTEIVKGDVAAGDPVIISEQAAASGKSVLPSLRF